MDISAESPAFTHPDYCHKSNGGTRCTCGADERAARESRAPSTVIPQPIPKLVQAFLSKSDNFDTAQDLYDFIGKKVERAVPSPAVVAYMIGCTYEEARSMVRWYERGLKQGPTV